MVKNFLFIDVIIFCLFVNSGFISAQEWEEESKWKISGYFKNASGWLISEENAYEMLKCENIFQLEPTYKVSEHIKIFGVFRAYYDAVFDLEKSGWTDEFRFKDEIRKHNANTISDPVREFYADIRWDRFFIRLGKQQVAWGEAKMVSNEYLKQFMAQFPHEGLTFDDVSLVTQYADFLPDDSNIRTKLSERISLNMPFISAAMPCSRTP